MKTLEFDLAVGFGPCSGWTRKDFSDEMRAQREVMESASTTLEQKEEALKAAWGLKIRCDDPEMFDGIIYAHATEMQKRFFMVLNLEIENA